MKRIACLAFFVHFTFHSFSQTPPISLIPEPVSLEQGKGAFRLDKSSIIITGSSPEVKRVGEMLSQKLQVATGYHLPVESSNSGKPGTISLSLISDASLGKEGYRLEVRPTQVSIKAPQAAGLFYGMQTLLQLFPKEIESKTVQSDVVWKAPAVTIADYPRFGWRGLLFDVSRHFFTKQQVEAFIDDMVRYKYNLLHLHLTDDQGWRIEIKSLPNLTKVGAWRPQRAGAWGHAKEVQPNEPMTYGGFFTQEDMKEIIRYASDRFVNILPEIDVPAHSMAAIASYPEISCTPGTYHVNAGEEFQVWDKGGNRSLIDNTLCPANEKAYAFLDKVFTEVAQLFPFEYIHVGGDEAAKNFWEQSTAVKELMQKEGLKNVEEVQSYFMKRVEKIIQSKGKKLIGWDEILEGGLAPSATVMSWRGMKGGIEAAKMNHPVVMAPEDYTYVDLMQGDPYVEPPEFATLLISQAYKFEPIPEGVNPKLILGGEACLWSEHSTNMRAAQYLLWPRTMAVAECVWTPSKNKNWPDFVRRVEQHFGRLDAAQVNYSRSLYDPAFHVSTNSQGQLVVELTNEIPGLDVHYSFDETNPDRYYPKYTGPLVVPPDAVHLKVVTCRNGVPIGRQINMPIEELQKRLTTKKG